MAFVSIHFLLFFTVFHHDVARNVRKGGFFVWYRSLLSIDFPVVLDGTNLYVRMMFGVRPAEVSSVGICNRDQRNPINQ